MDSYINKLYRQAEYCNYGDLREELIRDRLVVGVKDDRLSEKLQSTANLTLVNAVEICRRHEAAKQAQSVVRPPTNATATSAVDMVKHRRNRQTPNNGGKRHTNQPQAGKQSGKSDNTNSNTKCNRC